LRGILFLAQLSRGSKCNLNAVAFSKLLLECNRGSLGKNLSRCSENGDIISEKVGLVKELNVMSICSRWER